MPYQVKLHRGVVKSLDRMEPKLRERIKSALRKLADNPYESRAGVDILRLTGKRVDRTCTD